MWEVHTLHTLQKGTVIQWPVSFSFERGKATSDFWKPVFYTIVMTKWNCPTSVAMSYKHKDADDTNSIFKSRKQDV